MDGIVEIPGIHIAHGKMHFASEFRAKAGDVAFENKAEIVVLLPVSGDLRIDLPG